MLERNSHWQLSLLLQFLLLENLKTENTANTAVIEYQVQIRISSLLFCISERKEKWYDF